MKRIVSVFEFMNCCDPGNKNVGNKVSLNNDEFWVCTFFCRYCAINPARLQVYNLLNVTLFVTWFSLRKSAHHWAILLAVVWRVLVVSEACTSQPPDEPSCVSFSKKCMKTADCCKRDLWSRTIQCGSNNPSALTTSYFCGPYQVLTHLKPGTGTAASVANHCFFGPLFPPLFYYSLIRFAINLFSFIQGS